MQKIKGMLGVFWVLYVTLKYPSLLHKRVVWSAPHCISTEWNVAWQNLTKEFYRIITLSCPSFTYIYLLRDFQLSSEDNVSRTHDHVLCHRVVEIHQNQYFVTKGDSNKLDDRWMFSKAKNRRYGLERHHLIGKIHGRLPYIGLPVLMVRETYWGKVSI